MALVGRRDGHNFGYGRQFCYAGPQVLKDMFGGGHYGTVKVHSDRGLESSTPSVKLVTANHLFLYLYSC